MSTVFSRLRASLAVLCLVASGLSAQGRTQTAVFAGGCFWGVDAVFKHVRGVERVVSGYSGGRGGAATAHYNLVSTDTTGHAESVEVTFNPAQVSYEKLLAIYWSNIDPTQADGQFADVGLSYQAAIYYGNDEEKKIVEASKEALGKSGLYEKPIVTQILPAMTFYPAEEYHQKYYLKNASHYEAYHVGSGREAYQKKMATKKQKSKAPSPVASPTR